MVDVSLKKLAHLKSEKIQIFLRIFLITSVVVTLYLFNSSYLLLRVNEYITILDIFLAVIALNILYYLFIFQYPFLLQSVRIGVIAVLDVVSSVYIMYLVGDVSEYYTVLLLWYMLGYGLRYGKEVAYIVYVSILLSWYLLITHSPFWIENASSAYSWFIAYAILPLYYFHIVNSLKEDLLSLEKNLEKNRHFATHDTLTNLPNRHSFEKKLLESTENLKQFALLFIDLDEFKNVNDKFGHHIGDKVLQAFSKKILSAENYTARLGGDEFVAIIEYDSLEALEHKVKALVKTINMKCDFKEITLSGSVGVSLFPYDAKNIYDLKKKSDVAMYEAKKRGKNRSVFYKNMDNKQKN